MNPLKVFDGAFSFLMNLFHLVQAVSSSIEESLECEPLTLQGHALAVLSDPPEVLLKGL